MKNATAFLALALTDWSHVVKEPALCQRLILGRRYTKDEFMAALFRSLVCHNGDWRAAARWLERERPACLERVQKFRRWAEKITAPRRRGRMLGWKGGAV